jgi:hypothetical protein
MKVILITAITPYKENYKGTSALQYHLLVHRSDDIEVEIFSFNINSLTEERICEVEKELNVKIHIMERPVWLEWMFKFHLLFLRVFFSLPVECYIKLKESVVEEIKAMRPHGILVYGEELSQIMKQFPSHRTVGIGPDSEALYYYRMLGQRFVFTHIGEYVKHLLMYRKYLRCEHAYMTKKDSVYIVVGREDANFIRNINPNVDIRFLRHPHYDIKEAAEKEEIRFSKPIKLLLAGQNNRYMEQDATIMLADMLVNTDKLSMYFELTFLGKGWEQQCTAFQQRGWTARHLNFAPDYIGEVAQHDIQLAPITVGTGTKGKVLDALSNGLLLIGSRYALENIAVNSGDSCLEYATPEQVSFFLQDIACNTSKYEKVAHKGMMSIRQKHNRAEIAENLFRLFS